MRDVLVFGCGLIGTSVALALRGAGRDVVLHDVDPEALAVAVARGAGLPWDGQEGVAVALVAVPPRHTAAALIELQGREVAQTYTHVCSVQSHVQEEVEARSPDPSRVVGGHPLAGRELSGPHAGTANLFVGRPWAVCAGEAVAPDALDEVLELAQTCGATPVRVAPADHDSAVALLSHLPHAVSSTLAAALLDSRVTVRTGDGQDPTMRLSGPGLADTTRLAAGDADLWTDILTANAAEVAPLVRVVAGRLTELAAALESSAGSGSHAAEGWQTVHGMLRAGNAGRALVPVKRGESEEAFAAVRVELEDRPGELARVLAAAGAAGINVEDLRVEHVPGHPRGVVELAVSTEGADRLADALRNTGWRTWMSTHRSG